ncbi:MAG: FG-GAP repeat domain-containing protein [bacterium]
MRRIQIAVILLILTIRPAPRAESSEIAFDKHPLRVAGGITNIIARDLNGDGSKEIIVLHADGGKRFVSVIKGGGNPDPRGEQTIEVSHDDVVVDIGDPDGDGRGDILLMGANRVALIPQGSNGRFGSEETLLEVPSIFFAPQEDGLVYWNFIEDFNGDGWDDVIVPQGYGYKFFPGGESGFDIGRVHILGLEYNSKLDTGFKELLQLTYTLPDIVAFDFDGDRRKDIIIYDYRSLSVFCQRNGAYPPEYVRRVSIDSSDELPPRDGGENPYSGITNPFRKVLIDDLNSDGIPDLIKSKISVKGFLATNYLYVFIGRPNDGFDVPIRIIPRSGSIGLFLVDDSNGDGKKDIMIPSISISFGTLLGLIFTRTVRVDTAFYIQSKDNFPEEPTYERSIDFKLGFDLNNSLANVGSGFGDFNGDRRPDGVISNGDGKIFIYPGQPDGRIGVAPVAEVAANPRDRFCIADLNGDGISDLTVAGKDSIGIFITRSPVRRKGG